MSPIISKDLNDDGTRFVNAQLLAGGILSQAVLAVCGPIVRASAPLPEELDSATLTNFEHGEVTSLSRTINWLVPNIVKAHMGDSQFSVLIEDIWFKPSDVTDPSREPILKLLEEDALVYALNGDQLSEPVLKSFFKLVRSFQFCGFIVNKSDLLDCPAGSISASELTKHVKSVFVSAFDREGIIVGNWASKQTVGR